MTQEKIKEFWRKQFKLFGMTDEERKILNLTLSDDLTSLLDNCQPKDVEDLDFGDYCTIEQRRYDFTTDSAFKEYESCTIFNERNRKAFKRINEFNRERIVGLY